MVKLDFKNTVTLVGYVNGFKLIPYKNGSGAVANIAIKDEKGGSTHFVTMFTNRNKKFKYDGNEYDPAVLRNMFIDEEGKPRHILVNAFCGMAENKYTNSQGVDVVSTQILVRKLSSSNEPDAQKATFDVRGYVESAAPRGDVYRIKVATLSKDANENVNNVTYITLETDESISEVAMDAAEKGNYVKFRGRLINKTMYDDLGDRIGTVKKNNVLKITDVVEKDDIPEKDIMIYKLAKKLGKGEYVDVKTAKTMKYGESTSAVEVDDDEDIDIDFD